jgi:hypothetical protein
MPDGDGSEHEHALSSRPGPSMQELVSSRPAQDQRGNLRSVDARRHAGQAVGP